MARAHDSLLRSLPLGSALQVLMTIAPTCEVPGWERLRASVRPAGWLAPILDAQGTALAQGFPHHDGAAPGRLRTIRTLVTFRLPVGALAPSIPLLLDALLSLPSRQSQGLAGRMRAALAETVTQLGGYRAGIAETLRAAGHQVTALDGAGVGQALAAALDPLGDIPSALDDAVPLKEQVLTHDATRQTGGWTFGQGETALTARVLSLHRAPPRTYPGMLSAPRAPEGAQPLALWDAWPGALTLCVNVAVIDQGKERDRLRWKRHFAVLQGKSLENAAIKDELDGLLRTFFVSGGHLFWTRIHCVLWGANPPRLARGVQDVIRVGRRLDLEWVPEPTLGSTLFLQTLPLGFDPTWPSEKTLRRERRIPGIHVANLLPLYGGFRGTPTASVLYLNQRGESVGFDPFDNVTNPHMVITGMSGAGKSFTVGHLAQQVLPLGASMVILDRLPSYQDLCAVWDGTYLAMNFQMPLCFNPFYGPLDAEHVAFLTAVLAELASGGTERLNREALNVLADAVAYFAQRWEPARGEPRLGVFVEEVLQDGAFSAKDALARRLGKSLARKLSMFHSRGPFAGFFDGPNQLALHPTLTVVELSQLRDAPDLQGGLLFCLLHLLKVHFAAPERLHQRKFFVSDETWSLLKHPATAEVIEEIARTYRKLRTSAIFLSQYAEDFSSPAGRVIRKGSPVTLFLQQEQEELAELTALLKLSPAEHALLTQVGRHAGWSTMYLRLPAHTGGLVRLIPDRYTALLLGQDDQTRRRRDAALAQTGGNMRAAMALLLAEERDA
jgi:conjugal transfer ATP-binding protein TraC